jgi:hypothetical protein
MPVSERLPSSSSSDAEDLDSNAPPTTSDRHVASSRAVSPPVLACGSAADAVGLLIAAQRRRRGPSTMAIAVGEYLQPGSGLKRGS